MKITEVEGQLPNGLHDADLLNIRVDYGRRTAVLDFIADYSGPETVQNELNRRVTLKVSGLHFISVPAPDLSNSYKCDGPADVGGFLSLEESKHVSAKVMDAARRLPPSAFCEAMYVSDWNDFIVIAAEDAQIEIGK